MSKKDREFMQSAILNNETFNFYYNKLFELATNRYKWGGLPETIDPRFLEISIFTKGCAVFFKDEVVGFLALPCMYGGVLDVYNNPTDITAYATNGYQARLNKENCVIIWNNYLREPSLKSIELYARRLYEIERAIDTNVKQQKTPLIIRSTESQRLVMTNLYQKYDGNQPFIFGDKNLDLDGVKVLNTQAPYNADKLQLLKRQYWSEALTYLGIDNVSTEKRERLVGEEVTGNLSVVDANRTVGLRTRQQAADKINKMFGLNITVDFEYQSQLQGGVVDE